MLSFFCLISFHLFFKYFHLKGELGYPYFPLFGHRASTAARLEWQAYKRRVSRLVRGYTIW